MTVRATITAGIAAVVLAACGQAPAQPKSKEPAAPPKTGIFTSSRDCAERSKLEPKVCSKLIEKAIEAHLEKSKTYISMRLCEAAEGVDRCERSVANAFRPQLAAFLVTLSTPPTAEPLYGPKDNTVVGFATAGQKRTILAVDETMMVTPAAHAIAEGFAIRR